MYTSFTTSWEAAANKLQATLGPSEVRQLNNTKKTMDEEAEDGAEDGCPEIPTAWAPEVSEPAERTGHRHDDLLGGEGNCEGFYLAALQ